MESKVIDRERKIGSVQVFGDLDGSTSPTLLREIEGLLEGGMINIIINLEGIEFISSSGIGVIAISSKDLSRRNGKIIVICNNKKVISLFNITNLSKVITVAKTDDEALSKVWYSTVTSLWITVIYGVYRKTIKIKETRLRWKQG